MFAACGVAGPTSALTFQRLLLSSGVHFAGQLPAGHSSSGSSDGVAKRLVRRHSWGGPLQMAETELPVAQQAPAATSMVSDVSP